MDHAGDETEDAPVGFPLTSSAALRLWLLAALVLAVAAAGAWSMRGQASEVRIALPPVEEPAPEPTSLPTPGE